MNKHCLSRKYCLLKNRKKIIFIYEISECDKQISTFVVSLHINWKFSVICPIGSSKNDCMIRVLLTYKCRTVKSQPNVHENWNSFVFNRRQNLSRKFLKPKLINFHNRWSILPHVQQKKKSDAKHIFHTSEIGCHPQSKAGKWNSLYIYTQLCELLQPLVLFTIFLVEISADSLLDLLIQSLLWHLRIFGFNFQFTEVFYIHSSAIWNLLMLCEANIYPKIRTHV